MLVLLVTFHLTVSQSISASSALVPFHVYGQFACDINTSFHAVSHEEVILNLHAFLGTAHIFIST
jgi:hypothetical protein